jgi:putative hydrolase of the HAD superfamily
VAEPAGVRAVLLDLFDTLVHVGWDELRRQLADRAGVPARTWLRGYERTRSDRNTGRYPDPAAELQAVARAAGIELSGRRLAALAEYQHGYLLEHGGYYPDAAGFLAEVRSHGIPIGVVSNCSRNAGVLVRRLRLSELVDAVVLSFEVGARKPDPGIYRTALARLGARAAETVFVDDQPGYCAGAAAVGMRALTIRRPTADEPGTDTPDLHGLDWAALLDRVRRQPHRHPPGGGVRA